jgi:hypothetical protein
MGKKITGKYEKDENFITVFVEEEKAIYVMARNSSDYGCGKVGQHLADGRLFTQEMFDTWSAECDRVGTFVIEEERKYE